MAKFKIKSGDAVKVIAGKDKGKTGTVLKVLRDDARLLVSGVNMIKKHTKADAQNAGGIVSKEASLHISNVSLLDPKDSKPVRAGYKVEKDGSKVRIARRSGEKV